MGFSRKLTLQCSNPACTYTNNMHTYPRAEGRKHAHTINGLVSSTATGWQDQQVRTSNALELQRRMREGVVARLKFLDYSSATVIFFPGQYVPPMMIFRRILMAPVLGEGVLCEWSGPVRTTHDDIQEDNDGTSIGRGCVV